MPTNKLPTNVKLLRGTHNATRNAKNEPQPDIIDYQIIPPEDLSTEAKIIWDEYLPILQKMRVLTKADIQIFKSFCIACELADTAYAILKDQGPVVSEAMGSVKKNPAHTAYIEASKEKRALADILGLSPGARSKIEAQGNSKSGNKFKDL